VLVLALEALMLALVLMLVLAMEALMLVLELSPEIRDTHRRHSARNR
jgi:hypothetical protein